MIVSQLASSLYSGWSSHYIIGTTFADCIYVSCCILSAHVLSIVQVMQKLLHTNMCCLMQAVSCIPLIIYNINCWGMFLMNHSSVAQNDTTQRPWNCLCGTKLWEPS